MDELKSEERKRAKATNAIVHIDFITNFIFRSAAIERQRLTIRSAGARNKID